MTVDTLGRRVPPRCSIADLQTAQCRGRSPYSERPGGRGSRRAGGTCRLWLPLRLSRSFALPCGGSRYDQGLPATEVAALRWSDQFTKNGTARSCGQANCGGVAGRPRWRPARAIKRGGCHAEMKTPKLLRFLSISLWGHLTIDYNQSQFFDMINKPRAPTREIPVAAPDACPRAKTTIYVALTPLQPENRTRWYYRHRCLSAELGRFISRDPIGYRAGKLSLSEYCSSTPIQAVDPVGLEWYGPVCEPKLRGGKKVEYETEKSRVCGFGDELPVDRSYLFTVWLDALDGHYRVTPSDDGVDVDVEGWGVWWRGVFAWSIKHLEKKYKIGVSCRANSQKSRRCSDACCEIVVNANTPEKTQTDGVLSIVAASGYSKTSCSSATIAVAVGYSFGGSPVVNLGLEKGGVGGSISFPGARWSHGTTAVFEFECVSRE